MRAIILVALLLGGCANMGPREEAAVTVGAAILAGSIIIAAHRHDARPGQTWAIERDPTWFPEH